MKYLSTFLLFLILAILTQICFILEEIQEENSLRVTAIHHHYEYAVESYGPIQLNDKLVDMTFKPNKED